MAYENLMTSDKNAVRVITINRPSVMNALNKKTLQELGRAMEDVESDPKLRAVVITGSGPKSFVAGADISEMKTLSPLEAQAFSKLGHRVFDYFSKMRVPVIAAVNGFALGGGLELALACDFIYASENAVFGLVESKLGLVPGFGGVARLTRRVGDAMAREMIFAASQINASEALRIGIVNQVVSEGEVVAAAIGAAERIAQRGPCAIALVKGLICEGQDGSLQTANAMEQNAFGMAFSTEDHMEGIRAFVEKRTPNFQGK